MLLLVPDNPQPQPGSPPRAWGEWTASGTRHTSCPLGLCSPAPSVLCCRWAERLCLTPVPTNPVHENTRYKLCWWLWSAQLVLTAGSHPGGVLSPRGHWARSGDILVVSLEGCYWPPVCTRWGRCLKSENTQMAHTEKCPPKGRCTGRSLPPKATFTGWAGQVEPWVRPTAVGQAPSSGLPPPTQHRPGA